MLMDSLRAHRPLRQDDVGQVRWTLWRRLKDRRPVITTAQTRRIQLLHVHKTRLCQVRQHSSAAKHAQLQRSALAAMKNGLTIKVLAASSITFKEKSPSYIYSLTRDALTLSSESNGKNSGWMYLINGGSPTVGIRDYKLSLGDDIVFFYTDDYTKDTPCGTVTSMAV